MAFNFEKSKILLEEFNNSKIDLHWYEFINSKDIGICYISYDDTSGIAKYVVTCEKKLMLAKLKYGV